MKLIYLKEAVDFSTPESFIKEIKKGTTGLSPSILNKKYPEEDIGVKASALLDSLKNNLSQKVNTQPQDINSMIIFILRKFKEQDSINQISLFLRSHGADQFYDTLYAYYKNKNKKEFKEDERAINLKKKFEDMKYPFDNDIMSAFEHYCTEKFVEKANIKNDSEIDILYNKDGWEVIVPKTFAASKKFACMNNRKAKWCTAAQSHNFNNYTRDGNKLFIIRNKNKDVMFQMDWGDNNGYPNFMDEEDNLTEISTFIKLKPPKDMLAIIKNKDGLTLSSILDDTVKEEKFLDGWTKKEYSYLSLIKDYPYFKSDTLDSVLENIKKTGTSFPVYTKTIRGQKKVIIKHKKDYYHIDKNIFKLLHLEDLGNYVKGNLELKKTIEPDIKESILKEGAKKTTIYKSKELLIEKLHNRAAIISEIKYEPIKKEISLKKELLKKEKSIENSLNSLIEKSISAIKITTSFNSYSPIKFLILNPSKKIINLLNYQSHDKNSIYEDLIKVAKNILSNNEKIQLFKVLPDLKDFITKDLLKYKFPKPMIEGKSIKIYERDPRTEQMFNLSSKKDENNIRYIIKQGTNIYPLSFKDIILLIKEENFILPNKMSFNIKKEFGMDIENFLKALTDRKTTESSYSKEYLDKSFNEKKDAYKKSIPTIQKKVLKNIEG